MCQKICELVLIIVLTSVSFIESKYSLEKIVSLCDDESINVSQLEEVTTFSGAEYNQKLANYVTGGISKVLWDNIQNLVKDEDLVKVGLGSKCSVALRNTVESASNGKRWAFELMVSGGKSQEKLMKGMMTSLGDYETCLHVTIPTGGIGNEGGKYCLVDVCPKRFLNSSKGIFSLDKVPIYDLAPFKHGICIPSSCDGNDVRLLLQKSLTGYPMVVKSDEILCDTITSISWSLRFNNLTVHQIISIIFVLVLSSVIIGSTIIHMASMFIYKSENGNLVTALSCWENTKRLFIKSQNKNIRLNAIDYFKLFAAIFMIFGHFAIAPEMPNTFHMIDLLENMDWIMSKAITQMAMNENTITMFSVMGGFLMHVTLYPMIKQRKMPYPIVILFRYIHFLPSVICVTACEFIWTALFSGPFYRTTASFILDKCTRNWWRNVLFIQNFYFSHTPNEICVGQAFSLAVDFQLFLYGLLALFFISKSTKFGVIFCILSWIVSYVVVAIRAVTYETTATIFTPNPSPVKIVEYMQYIYTPVVTYIPSYVVGLGCGFLYNSGYKFSIKSRFDHVKYIGISTLFVMLVNLNNGLANEFNLIPKSLNWLHIISNKIYYTATITILMIYFLSIDNMFGHDLPPLKSQFTDESIVEENNNVPNSNGKKVDPMAVSDKESKVEYSVLTAFYRLAYAINLSNYLLAKYEIFTSRSILSFSFYPLIQRLLGSWILAIVWALIFHCLFVAPFQQLNKQYIFKLLKKKRQKSE